MIVCAMARYDTHNSWQCLVKSIYVILKQQSHFVNFIQFSKTLCKFFITNTVEKLSL